MGLRNVCVGGGGRGGRGKGERKKRSKVTKGSHT